jgi:Transposase
MVDVGVDLHRKRSHVVALDAAGEVVVVVSRRIGNAPAEFLRLFGELEPAPVEVVFEATYGRELVRGPAGRRRRPRPHGHPLATKAISAARVTNDAVDARTLAQLLRTNLLAEAWIAPPPPARPAGWSAPGPGWSGCAPASNPNSTRCWPTWASSPS